MKNLLHFSALFVGLIVAYLLFACASALLPDAPIRRGIVATNHNGDLWQNYPTAGIPQKQCRQDNFTDILILNQAWHCGSDSLFSNVLLLPRAVGPDRMDQADCLYRLVSGQPTHIRYYARYWHGSTFLMRFLLVFLGNYLRIRLFLYLFTTLLLFALCYRLARLANVAISLAFLSGLVLLNVFVMQLSIQFAPVLILALIGSLFVCRWHADPRRTSMLLFALGSLTAYFDLLTVPLLTVGIPVAVWVVVSVRSKSLCEWARPTLQIVLYGCLWAVGYALTWVTKWVLATWFTSANVLQDGFYETSRRTQSVGFSRFDALLANTAMVPWSLFLVVALVLAVLAIYRFRRKGVLSAMLLFALGLLPFVWYLVASNHSFEHAWFTYRNLMLTLSAWLMALGCIVDWARFRRRV